MAARLPTPGSDNDVWGDVLNTFLEVSHNNDGTINTSALEKAGGVTSINGKSPVNGTVTLAATDVGADAVGAAASAQAAAEAASVPITGGTMTGALTLSGNPTSTLQAATKQYVDTSAAGAMMFQGAWSAATAYAVGAVVSYNGNVYVCKTANTNQVPVATQLVTNSLATNLWITNGVATNNGTDATLLSNQNNAAGNLVYDTALTSPYIDCTFTMAATSGGADGFGFGIFDASATTTTTLGDNSTAVGILQPTLPSASFFIQFLTYTNDLIALNNAGQRVYVASMNPSGTNTWRITFSPASVAGSGKVNVTVYIGGVCVFTIDALTSITNCYPVFGAGSGSSTQTATLSAVSLSQITPSSYWSQIG